MGRGNWCYVHNQHVSKCRITEHQKHMTREKEKLVAWPFTVILMVIVLLSIAVWINS